MLRVAFHSEASERLLGSHEAVPDAGSPWRSCQVGGAGDRFFFDIDDGEQTRPDAVGTILPGREGMPRETKAILFDLAHADIPTGRSRVFAAELRDVGGVMVYRGTMTMRPLPVD